MRDPAPSAILQPRGLLLGTLWVSGLFTGFRQFLDGERIGLVINCLNTGQGEIIGLNFECWSLYGSCGDSPTQGGIRAGEWQEHLGALRTWGGSFVVLFLALIWRLRRAILHDLPSQFFGICPGVTQRGSRHQAAR